ncbi:3-oxoacyl-ACP synthase III family protein [Sphingobium boeckii]|uniref:3-oxoacyl-[acyl-carrier-protein] synthase-3 n=1 Tax=Sphingobium boeckii TaxID=1082345 RepID=A0A7W9AHJ9_9SPHN|nr:ketoacyl-ACP synthase III [Sphingobium boeckii]MBB5685740.1 3-oxoacyl-[acyl-carrier-protein] synthase-3 [Sphingobium boeckii]
MTTNVQNAVSGVVNAHIAAIATHVPEAVLDNATLAALYPEWPAEKIFDKTGIATRHIAGPAETALDLGVAASEKLFTQAAISRDDIDFLIFCTQAPDYVLPTSACVMQDRLKLNNGIGALDINLGCSGFVYGLSLAAGLIAAGLASAVLLVTADTYSKYIHLQDKSVRTLFGDGAAATLIRRNDAGDTGSIGPFEFGTDGGGAHQLIVEGGGFRTPRSAETATETIDKSGNVRSRDHLYMNGGAVLNFTLKRVPEVVARLTGKMNLQLEAFDKVILHQANKFLLDSLQKKLGLGDDAMPRRYADIGNTVSSSIPFVLEDIAEQRRFPPGRHMLVGFGVGLSWAACSVSF